jgi:hypothetical protein
MHKHGMIRLIPKSALGSGADIIRHQANVRFAPESGQRADMPACPLCADFVVKLVEPPEEQ